MKKDQVFSSGQQNKVILLSINTMAWPKLIKFAYQRFITRKFHDTANRMSSNWRHLMKKELQSGNSAKQEESHPHHPHPVCIYRVPSNMRQVEPKAYRPNNISIGPCHYGAPQLKNMEDHSHVSRSEAQDT